MVKYLVPLILFIVLAGFLAVGLKLDPHEIPSPLINKPAPDFNLPRLLKTGEKLNNQSLKGQVWLLNVWASWCVSCRSEHPVLNQLAQKKLVTLVGLNYKDVSQEAKQWLAQLGNPYDYIAQDQDGRTGIDYGVYGVPETFIIDKQGVIRHKITGPISMQIIQDTLIPLISQLKGES